MRLRRAAWWSGFVLDGDKIVVSCRCLGAWLGNPIRRAKRGCLPVDFVVALLLERAGGHGCQVNARCGVPGLPACADPTPSSTVVNRLAAMRRRFHSRPASDRRQQREHSGAVLLLRTWQPQVVHSGRAGSRPARRRRRRRIDSAVMSWVASVSPCKGPVSRDPWCTRDGRAEAP